VRVSVLDFDAFPSDPREQLSLIRFRLKKSLPFDVEAAATSFYPQASSGSDKKVDVVAAVAPIEIVARHEAPFRAAGLQVGWVTTSVLAALELVPPGGVKVLVKRSGPMLSLAVQAGRVLKLVRSIELAEVSPAEILAHLHPTLAYIEDRLGARPDVLLLCGFRALGDETRELFQQELGVETSPLGSRFGEPGEFNSGLLGYLESLEES
jgi:type IV pilus assembly protein PilM